MYKALLYFRRDFEQNRQTEFSPARKSSNYQERTVQSLFAEGPCEEYSLHYPRAKIYVGCAVP